MKTINERADIISNTFQNKALSFLKGMEERMGNDLIYSLALEAGNVFLCVAAHPSMTPKRWDTERERILFLIDEEEYGMDQDELIEVLSERLEDHMYYVTAGPEENETETS
jgi:hypothetical protein